MERPQCSRKAKHHRNHGREPEGKTHFSGLHSRNQHYENDLVQQCMQLAGLVAFAVVPLQSRDESLRPHSPASMATFREQMPPGIQSL
jgi:hypothetical protein